MCLAVIDWRPGHPVPLRVVANRDEFRNRATENMHWWPDQPILAGRDLAAGGTWLGVKRDGRFALLTNIRPGFIGKTAPLSRGELVVNYLTRFSDIESFHAWLISRVDQYGGFNLVLGEQGRLFWCSSIRPEGQFLERGIYGLSNHALNTPWPKLNLARAQMEQYSDQMLVNLTEHPILSSTEVAADASLPDTGLPLDRERMVSAQTITDSEYGTRSRTHFIQYSNGRFDIAEQQLNVQGDVTEVNHFTTGDDSH